MYGKIMIKVKLTVLTGMHIGGSNSFSAIGAVDSVVIRDAISRMPMIPGSSLKGKMRTLLARSIANNIHLNDCNKDQPEVIRLFGSSSKPIIKSRLQFSDAFLSNADFLNEAGGTTEVKFENTINRATAIANPRQIERVVRGAEFKMTLVYDVDNEEEIHADFENIAKALKLLQMDYLGGHGTRGYGKVKFSDFDVNIIEGKDMCIDAVQISKVLESVDEYELLSL